MRRRPRVAALTFSLLFGVLSTLARQPDLLLPVSSETPCQNRNPKLSTWLKSKLNNSNDQLIPRTKDFHEFVLELKAALDANMLSDRALHHVFGGKADFHPTCAGDYMEFGVAAGLPEPWIRDKGKNGTYAVHDFSQRDNGGMPKVEPNVHLVKGLFNVSLPRFLQEQAVFAGNNTAASYLHIDCDLYQGTSDALTLLTPRIKVGTVLVFDELVNYQFYRNHELKALWNWLMDTGSKLATIGMLGPLPGKTYAMELDLPDAAGWFHQSAAFVVAYQPDRVRKSKAQHRSS